MKNHDAIVLKVISNKRGNNNTRKTEKLDRYPNISEYLLNRYPDSLSKAETIMRMRLNIEVRPTCMTCGKPTAFTNKIKRPFTTYCSHECSCNTKERLDKFKQTCLNRYGYCTPLEDPTRREVGKQTSLRRYGASHPFKSDVVKERYRKTCIERYDVDWNSKTRQWKSKMSDIMSSEEIQTSRNIKLRENRSFNTSKPEEELFSHIREKFPSVIRQHKDKRYPWSCDFYIPELDLFLELNGTWTHGKHSYNSNSIKDQVVVEKWKSKNTRYYDNAIKTWTIRDVSKREMAKKSNLNFKEVWSLREGKEFIDAIFNKFN